MLRPISSGQLTYGEMQLPPGPFGHPVYVNAGQAEVPYHLLAVPLFHLGRLKRHVRMLVHCSDGLVSCSGITLTPAPTLLLGGEAGSLPSWDIHIRSDT